MRVSFINAKETSSFGVSIRYLQIGDEVITFGDEISEGDNVELSGSRLVPTPDDDECNYWAAALTGDSIFLSSGGEILMKGICSYNSKKMALVKVPVNGWALTYSAYDDEFTLFHFTDKVEWEKGTNADVALAFYGIEFPIEVTVEEGDE